MTGVFAGGERQAFIAGRESGRDHATQICQLLVASIQQRYEKDGDQLGARVAQDIADVLSNYNWGMDGERPKMPDRGQLDVTE